MLKTLFAKQRDKKFLCKVRIGVIFPFFYKKPGPFGGTDEWVRRNDPVKLCPDLIDVGRIKAVVPFTNLYLSVLNGSRQAFLRFRRIHIDLLRLPACSSAAGFCHVE